ncbi:MAG TPA: hypothetical protein VFM79_11530, partial [Pelobium sp.]|nr:hypothetical protein [Pelobium sp.]
MKKGILLFCGLFLALFVNRANAQDFDLDFYQYFNANIGTFGGSDAKSEATKWRGSKTDGSIGPIVTMNNISARVVQNSRINSISVGEDNTATQNFIRFQLGHNDCQIVLESTVDIKTIALVYRSSSTTATGLKISYGAS